MTHAKLVEKTGAGYPLIGRGTQIDEKSITAYGLYECYGIGGHTLVVRTIDGIYAIQTTKLEGPQKKTFAGIKKALQVEFGRNLGFRSAKISGIKWSGI